MEAIHIGSAQYTDVGARAPNEDTVLLLQSERLIAAMVADGLGGHGKGDQASAAAATVLQDAFADLAPLSVDRIAALCQEMNRTILRMQSGGQRMKSTLAVIFSDGQTTLFAHVGDSRIYYFRGRRILYQSLDHSVSQLAVLANEIRPKDIRFHVDRNKILHALGEDENTFRAEICVSAVKPSAGDGILICSDGFWEHVVEKDMLRSLRKSKDAQTWLMHMRHQMQKKPIINQDNNSAITIIFR